MKRIKIAIGLGGLCVVLEKFPDDKEHAGLNEMLNEFQDYSEFEEESPGVYSCQMAVGHSTGPGGDPQEDSAFLDVVDLKLLEVVE